MLKVDRLVGGWMDGWIHRLKDRWIDNVKRDIDTHTTFSVLKIAYEVVIVIMAIIIWT